MHEMHVHETLNVFAVREKCFQSVCEMRLPSMSHEFALYLVSGGYCICISIKPLPVWNMYEVMNYSIYTNAVWLVHVYNGVPTMEN